jgi:hypothetical protein
MWSATSPVSTFCFEAGMAFIADLETLLLVKEDKRQTDKLPVS